MSLLVKNINSSIADKKQMLLDQYLQLEFFDVFDAVIKSCVAGGHLYIAGNVGSAADAQHLADEFVSSKLATNTEPLPDDALRGG